jgi:hypothetical protein
MEAPWIRKKKMVMREVMAPSEISPISSSGRLGHETATNALKVQKCQLEVAQIKRKRDVLQAVMGIFPGAIISTADVKMLDKMSAVTGLSANGGRGPEKGTGEDLRNGKGDRWAIAALIMVAMLEEISEMLLVDSRGRTVEHGRASGSISVRNFVHTVDGHSKNAHLHRRRQILR